MPDAGFKVGGARIHRLADLELERRFQCIDQQLIEFVVEPIEREPQGVFALGVLLGVSQIFFLFIQAQLAHKSREIGLDNVQRLKFGPVLTGK